MTDVQYWEEKLKDEIDDIRSILNTIPQLQNDEMERKSRISNAETKLRVTNGTKRALKMETRLVTDHATRKKYEEKWQAHERAVSNLVSDLKALRAEEGKSTLFLGRKKDHLDGGKYNDNGEENGDALLDDMGRIQNKTQESLNKTSQMINEAKEVGVGTVEELGRQRHQIEGINRDVDRIEGELSRADRLIKTFAKRMATDKMFQCFACVNVLLLVAVVIYAIVKGGGLGNKDEGVPENPIDPAARLLRGFLLQNVGVMLDDEENNNVDS
mmetsp:Transcript_2972/g.4165  ORF Transcript_2972/g.4165 Transcript_2972/m.4165 type:complete len:271 (+) Transcript_2972:57-869(+)|eukprot:CAMPEP_0184855556 /NCGR_PEP_ID=MMETSP0580-20130426/765_1 /TAXON_ID=1118495 /ORGANISM="Dactyliosolen fragilissimus" /LENGTH=270 /DNA_ID=CAMNT_0027350097 /DNA_START=30 /DNA_END=842 /DNA_ORIENTATION=+